MGPVVWPAPATRLWVVVAGATLYWRGGWHERQSRVRGKAARQLRALSGELSRAPHGSGEVGALGRCPGVFNLLRCEAAGGASRSLGRFPVCFSLLCGLSFGATLTWSCRP